MGRLFGRILGVIGLPGDAETIGKIVAAMLTFAGGTGVWGYFTEGLPWAVFIATGVFFFSVTAYVIITHAHSVRRLPNKIYVADMGAMQWSIKDSGKKANIQLLMALNSMASFEIFFDVVSAEFTIGGVPSTPDKTQTINGVLAPVGFANIILGTVTTDHNFTNGRLALKINYGREKDKFTHQMDTAIEFFPVATLLPDQQGFLNLMRNALALEYRRLPDA